MTVSLRKYMVALTGVIILGSLTARHPLAQTVATENYVGAAACKDCHLGQYEAWERTKHSKALSKLQSANREGGTCIRCHVTGSDAMIAAQGANPKFPNVQCEGCHGPGAAHIAAAATGDTVTDRPKHTTEATCTRCHNETSPHYKPFYYSAMVGLVHRVK